MRVRTGIPGMDELVGGGFPERSFVLVSGKIGTGKSTLAMQYIVNGIVEYGAPGVFVSLERDKRGLYQDAEAFGWQLRRLENEGSLKILGGPLASVGAAMKKAGAAVEDILSEVIEVVETSGLRRMALDGVGALSIFLAEESPLEESLLKMQLSGFKEELAKLGCTSLLTSEVREGKEELSKVGIEEIADGVIVLYFEGEGLTRDRAIEVRKMKRTEHSNKLHFFDITDKGIVIKKLPEELEVKNSSSPPSSKCLFCGTHLGKPIKLQNGGRVGFCDSCISELEEKGLLKKHDDGTVELKKPIFEVIANYSSE